MKTLNQMEPAEFLRRCWLIVDAVSGFLSETKILELRKVVPAITGDETPEELEKKKEDQARKNIKAMVKSLLFDNADATANILPLFYELEVEADGTPEKITPFKTLGVLTATIEDKDVLDFLVSLMKLGQKNIDV